MPAIEYLKSAPKALEKDRVRREPSRVETGENATRIQQRIKPDWWKTTLVASAVILVAAGYISWRHFRATGLTGSDKIRLAVLPFQNLTGDTTPIASEAPRRRWLNSGIQAERKS